MRPGDLVKVFSSISDYDGQLGKIVLVTSSIDCPYLVQFGDAIIEPFAARDLIVQKGRTEE